MTYRQMIETLRALVNPANITGMARYGISPVGTLGVPMPVLRKMAKEVGCRMTWPTSSGAQRYTKPGSS
jgi:hypothetical protein